MSKEVLVIVLGVWILIVPFLGIPSSWKTTIFALSGLAIVVIGFLLRTEAYSRGTKRPEHRKFVENFGPSAADQDSHERKEGITSLN